MMKIRVFRTLFFVLVAAAFLGEGCSKSSSPPPPPGNFLLKSSGIPGFNDGKRIRIASRTPAAEFSFSSRLDRASVTATSVTFKTTAGANVAYTASYKKNDSVLVLQP